MILHRDITSNVFISLRGRERSITHYEVFLTICQLERGEKNHYERKEDSRESHSC